MILSYAAAGAVAVLAGGIFLADSLFGGANTVAALNKTTHLHGIAVDPSDPSRILLATHHGLHIASADGTVEQVSTTSDDFMGFVPHPTEPEVFYASGHPQSGGNMGFIASRDGGRTWTRVSPGVDGPVDFHNMDVSKADPNVIYGDYAGIQLSRDGGKTWEFVGTGPAPLIDLAASARDSETVYAATEAGLRISMDAGKSWQPTKLYGKPVSLVEVTGEGRMFAFLVGEGLMRGAEGSPKWEALSSDFGDRILLHLAVDPSDPDRLYAATQKSEVLASSDGGRTWQLFGSQR